MNAIRLRITAILAMLSAISPLAQSSDFAPLLVAAPYTDAQSVASVVYENSMARNPLPGGVATDQTFNYGGTAKALWNAARVRTNALNMEVSRTDMVMSNDHASLAIYAPMQAVNVALSFAGYVAQSRLDDSSVTRVQVLSLVAQRQINAELKYSVKTNSYSKFDSFITYKMSPDSDPSKAGASAGVRYNIKF